MLPATLLASFNGCMIVAIAPLLMVMVRWALPAVGHWMMHPALLAYLLIALAFFGSLNADRILNRDHLLVGELMRAGAPADRAAGSDSWYTRTRNATDADYVERVADHLTRYTRGLETPTRRWLPLSVLLRDTMPPLEDFIVAGQPGPIGVSSALAVIMCGLFLLYRGVIDFRVPLIGCLAAYVTFIILPIPTVISSGPQWHWVVFRLPEVPPAVAITFVNYEMLASPLIFMLFLLATAPIISPMKRRSRTIFALILGVTAATFQLYVSVSYGPYLALFLVSVLSAELDRWLGAPMRR
jgi:Na+-translocating ferredoxin:NAD+ oxidoreductase RnfD subunit